MTKFLILKNDGECIGEATKVDETYSFILYSAISKYTGKPVEMQYTGEGWVDMELKLGIKLEEVST